MHLNSHFLHIFTALSSHNFKEFCTVLHTFRACLKLFLTFTAHFPRVLHSSAQLSTILQNVIKSTFPSIFEKFEHKNRNYIHFSMFVIPMNFIILFYCTVFQFRYMVKNTILYLSFRSTLLTHLVFQLVHLESIHPRSFSHYFF